MKKAAVAALGLALSACGGGAGSAAAGAPASQGLMSSDSSVPTDSSGLASGSTTDPGMSADAGGQSRTGSGSSSTSGSSTSGSSTSASGTSHSGTSHSGNGNLATPSTGNVTINWNAPTENTDGTPLTDLSGFKIHYGTASKKYTHTITVSNPGLATYVIADLARGTYYFAVSAYSSTGTESPLSSEVSTRIN